MRRWNGVDKQMAFDGFGCTPLWCRDWALEGGGDGMSAETEQFATKADLASLETRMVDRMGQLEARLMRDIANHDWRMIGAMIAVVSVAVAVLKLIP